MMTNTEALSKEIVEHHPHIADLLVMTRKVVRIAALEEACRAVLRVNWGAEGHAIVGEIRRLIEREPEVNK